MVLEMRELHRKRALEICIGVPLSLWPNTPVSMDRWAKHAGNSKWGAGSCTEITGDWQQETQEFQPARVAEPCKIHLRPQKGHILGVVLPGASRPVLTKLKTSFEEKKKIKMVHQQIDCQQIDCLLKQTSTTFTSKGKPHNSNNMAHTRFSLQIKFTRQATK